MCLCCRQDYIGLWYRENVLQHRTVASFVCCCREEYFGLRVRKLHDSAQAINIPVNTTVGPSGAPLEALFVLYSLD